MTSREDAAYRLRLAHGFLVHAAAALAAGVFFAAADAAQRAGENAAKALIALVEAPAKTHTPGDRVAQLAASGALAVPAGLPVEALLAALRVLGPDLHIEAGYGREDARVAPWDAIDRPRAEAALEAARVAVDLCAQVLAAAGVR